jgi:hypothetical protein
MFFLAGSVNRSDVHDLFPGRVRKASPRKTEQAKRNQDDSKHFVHGDLLLLKHFFNLADFLLDFAGDLFSLAFGRQVGVVRNLSHLLFSSTFDFMKLAFDLILRTWFHTAS